MEACKGALALGRGVPQLVITPQDSLGAIQARGIQNADPGTHAFVEAGKDRISHSVRECSYRLWQTRPSSPRRRAGGGSYPALYWRLASGSSVENESVASSSQTS